MRVSDMHYRLYFFDADDRIRHVLDLDCRDDEHARAMVREDGATGALELREGARLVERFEAG